jgi:uncharacterized protein
VVSLLNQRTGRVCLPLLHIRSGFRQRLCGYLMRRPAGPPGTEGMLLIDTPRVHTLFMGFPLDLYYLDGSLRVLERRPGIPPFRFPGSARGCRHVLEIPSAGGAEGEEILPGDRLVISIRVRP